MKRALLAALCLTALACNRLMQSPECAQYVACAEVFDPNVARQVRGAYGPQGTCWATNAITAEACTMTCTAQLQSYRNDGGQDVPECQPVTYPDAGAEADAGP